MNTQSNRLSWYVALHFIDMVLKVFHHDLNILVSLGMTQEIV